MKNIKLTNSELEIMEVLWETENALTSAEIVEKSKDSSWKKSSVHILLNSLLEKKIIEAEGFVKCKKTFARTFKPTITFEDYSAEQITTNKIFSDKSIPKIVASLLDYNGNIKNRESLKDELLKIIEEKTEEYLN